VKKPHIEAGVKGFSEKLEAVSIIGILLGISAMDSRQSGWFPKISQATVKEEIPPEEGASEVPSLRPQRTQDIQSSQANETPPVRRLDGEVTRNGETPFTGGTYCDVWVGRWVRPGSGEEKVSLSLTTFILLTGLFVGGLEGTPNRVTREGA
jgi:hypothetical protein